MANHPKVTIRIDIGGQNYTNYVLYAESSFEYNAFAQPGQATIVLRDPDRVLDPPLGKEVVLRINNRRVWGGYLIRREMSNFFPAGDGRGEDTHTRRWVLECVDYNIILDRLYAYNRADPTKMLRIFPVGTTDLTVIRYYMNNYFDVRETGLDWYTKTQSVGTPIPRSETATQLQQQTGFSGGGYFIGPGGTLRSLMEEVANNVSDSSQTGNIGFSAAAIYYINAAKQLYYGPPETFLAPFTVTDEGEAPGMVPCREFSVTTDITQIKNDVLVWALQRAPLVFRHNSYTASINQYGRWQHAEHVSDTYKYEVIHARSVALLNQYGNPSVLARFTVFTPGLEAGQIVNIRHSEFGTERSLPIRSVKLTFPTPYHARYDVEASIETNAPWRYWMALRRASRKGLQQPAFKSGEIDPLSPEDPIALPGMYFCETLTHESGLRYQTTFPFIKGSMQLFNNGLIMRFGLDYTTDDCDYGYVDVQDNITPGELYACYYASGVKTVNEPV